MTVSTAASASRVFDGTCWHDNSALLISDGRIDGIVGINDVPTGSRRVDYEDQLIVPGFIDLQVNGGGGVRFGDEEGRSFLLIRELGRWRQNT